MAESKNRFGRIANVINVVLFALSAVAFALGIVALGDRKDLHAVYWLVIGALSLKAAADMLRPRSVR
jgi:ABC-type Fe3+ transport system permease subunit